MKSTSARRLAGGGFSLIEVMIAVMVLSVALFGTLASLGLGSQVRETSKETEIATSVIQEQIESHRGALFGNVVTAIYADSDFSDEIADPLFANQVVSATIEILDEAEASTAFPMDVDKDGDIDAADVYDLDRDGTPGEVQAFIPGDTGAARTEHQGYRIVPLRFTMSWRNTRGGAIRTLQMDTFIYPQTNN